MLDDTHGKSCALELAILSSSKNFIKRCAVLEAFSALIAAARPSS